jgi:hypothetical protein
MKHRLPLSYWVDTPGKSERQRRIRPKRSVAKQEVAEGVVEIK